MAREGWTGIIEHLPETSEVRAAAALALGTSAGIEVTVTKTTPIPGASRLGGRPLAPRGFQWPQTSGGRPQPFVGQIDLAQVAAQVPAVASELPARGLLQLFFDGPYTGPRCVPDDCFRVLWFPDAPGPGDALADVPEPAPRLGKHGELRFVETSSLPDLDALLPALAWVEDLLDRDAWWYLSEEEAGARRYYESMSTVSRSDHHLLGYGVGIQYDPRKSTARDQLQLRGEAPEDGSWRPWPRLEALREGLGQGATEAATRRWWEQYLGDHPRELAVQRERARWRLLWQVDTDDALRLSWGDGGRLYVMIRDSDLAAGDLSGAWVDWQSH